MKRILAIDGGGIRGLIPAMFCQAIEKAAGQPICKLFDLVAGTSTGGILALGYAMPPAGISSDKLVTLYRQHGGTIFSGGTWVSWFKRKYGSGPLEHLLRQYFREVKVSEAIIEVLVTAYDIQMRCPFIVKRWQAKESPAEDWQMWQAARATAAAPTYFEPAPVDQHLLIDGGVVANNPAAAAFAEARYLWGNEDVLIVSVGTGSLAKPINPVKAREWGDIGWAKNVIDCMFDGSSKLTDSIMDQIIPRGSYRRFQINLTESASSLDNASETNLVELSSLGTRLVEERKGDIQELASILASTPGELTATIDSPALNKVVAPGWCPVYGSITGYTGQPVYLMTGKEGRYWSLNPLQMVGVNRWEGRVNLGKSSPTGTISVIVPDERLVDYIKFYKLHADAIGHGGISLTTPPTKIAEVSVVVDLSRPEIK